MAKVIIFGNGDTAELAYYYLTHDSEHKVTAFTVTSNLIDRDSIFGLPLVPFEDVHKLYPPKCYVFFVPSSGRNMSKPRRDFYEQAKEKGYSLISYIHSKAVTHNNAIGENCFILERVNLQPFVTIGNNVVIWSNVHVGHHSSVGNHSFLVTGTAIGGRCSIKDHCYTGLNSTVLQDLTLAEGTFISAGSMIKQSTVPWSVYKGNPATRRKIPSDRLNYL